MQLSWIRLDVVMGSWWCTKVDLDEPFIMSFSMACAGLSGAIGPSGASGANGPSGEHAVTPLCAIDVLLKLLAPGRYVWNSHR